MLINGINLTSLGASLHNRVLSSNSVETIDEWSDGAIEPEFIRQQDTFKSIALQFLITEQNEENAFIVMSNITMLLKKAIIVFDDMPNLQFDVSLNGQSKQERLKNGNFILTVNLKSDYAKGETEIHTTNTTATDSFNLAVVYYKDSTTLIANETIKIRASAFDKENVTFADLGIDVNKHQEDYYNNGVITNFAGLALNYDSLRTLGILIINYAPTVYYKDVTYYLYNGNSYDEIETTSVSYTYNQISSITSIGQLVNLNKNRPNGYKATCKFNLEVNFENINKFPTAIPVYYDIVEDEKTKDIEVTYVKETETGDTTISVQTVVVRESDIVDGTVISDIIGLNNYKPNDFYNNGYCIELDDNILLTFDTISDNYTIYYSLIESTVYIEYYKGEYPNWSRAYTDTLKVKYKDLYAESTNIIADLNINLNKYKNDLYNDGIVFNSSVYTDYQTVLNMGVVQIYYIPKEYTLTVKYQQDLDGDITQLATKNYTLTDLMFFTEPTLASLIDINLYRPEGYSYSEEDSYRGEITLSALTAASPITITYKATTTVRTKSIVVKYKKQLANTYATINSSVVTIEEAAIGGGIRLKDIFEVNKYKPEYYDNGIIDGYSSDAIVTFDEINGTYDVYYFASTYSTQIRYYTDEVSIENWIGSSRISYTILDFETETTITTLGANINQYKPPYCEDGVVQPYGTTTFANLINLESINIIYPSIAEPEDDSGIDYPHRILFLQHNDMGAYDYTFPTWTLNHAYINTGVVADDISQTTVTMSTVRMFEDQPLYNVNVGNAYLFGAISPRGSMYMRYENNTNYTNNPTGINYFRAMAGNGTPSVAIEEDSSNGFSRNTGIYASDKSGYSYMTLTYSNLIQSNAGNTVVPLFLFACDYNGNYTGGIAGVGITNCKIYKNGVLVRDYIPVQYYDLIGTKVAPSNCLYDKVTQTFFEDARGLNSFNIIDDDEYEDTNPLHNIGKCYANYYKDDGFFQSRVIYFRESDFINGKVWDPEEQLAIDEYQPQFYGPGEITNIRDLGGVTFNNVNNFVFEIHYPSTGYYINVNYYKDDTTQANLLASEQVLLTEDMFYQVPTFGQLVPLLKYKPEGYILDKSNYPYNQNKVTLKRLLQSQPFNIVYTPWEGTNFYNLTVSYYKHKNWIEPKHPLNQYEFLGSQTIVIDETQIIDGIYPEDFIEFNAMKPIGEENYWCDGVPFEWYLKDENLLSSDDLRENYIVVYEPKTQYIDIKYYTDEVDPDDFNLIASDTWAIRINDWAFGESFQIVDELPNNYINKYKPGNCMAGVLQNSDSWYTFASLVEQGHLNIIYMTKEEPHDPDDDSFPDKILFWYKDKTHSTATCSQDGQGGKQNSRFWQSHNGMDFPAEGDGACIPYLNLGYTPKELGRLTIQAKAYAVADSCWSSGYGQDYAPNVDDYTYFLGYFGATKVKDYLAELGYDNAKQMIFGSHGVGMYSNLYSLHSSQSLGWLAMRGHIPAIGGFGKQYNSPASVDGNSAQKWSNDAQTFVMDQRSYYENVKTMLGGYRLGAYATKDENFNPFIENHDYIYTFTKRNTTNPFTENTNRTGNHEACSWSNGLDYMWKSGTSTDAAGWYMETEINQPNEGSIGNKDWEEWPTAAFFHPTTVTIDAYNHFVEFYDISNDQNPLFYNIDTSNDYDLFVDREKPKGPIRLFVTTNPYTGEANIIPQSVPVYPWIKNYRTDLITGSTNPTQEDEGQQGEQESQNQPGTYESHGGLLEMAYNPYAIEASKTQGLNCPWVDYRLNAFPSLLRAAIWGIKIWDRGKLVRDLIPVEEGDQIYDYVAPANGLFDKVTEIFFTNENKGGTYTCYTRSGSYKKTVTADQVQTLRVKPDPTQYGKIVVNYYDYDNTFLGNKWVKIPTDYFANNILFKDLLAFNDYKPSIYYHDGVLDTDTWLEDTIPLRTRLKQVYDAGSVNVYYKQKQYTKTIVYYNENTRIASKDFFFSQHEIEEAETLADLGIDPELYRTADFGPGVVMSDESIIASDDVAAFIDAPSPVIVYHKYTKEERPDLLYVEYYRGGAYEEEGQESIVLNSENKNYLDCDLSAVVLNPNGLIKYINHYHSALYEDEEMPYFISYQVDVSANYVPIHKGPARAYTLLGHVTDRGRYTVIEERNGWGRLKEYPKGWILLSYTQPVVGPGQNPDYDVPTKANVTIPFGTRLSVTKMTIDRLWAYTPDYDSWIKTEEISYDQGGRLYNALAMKVIHLDQLDWQNINSLSDMGINIQQYKLRFHEDSPFSYNGDYTQSAFSDLHTIDIIYPETVYPYVVKYYQNIVDEDNILGRGGFSCSLSDWNPDWDTFLSTSYLTGYDGQTKKENAILYRTLGKTETKLIPNNEDIYIISGPHSYNETQCHYVMWGGYIGYMPDTDFVIMSTTRHSISPVLYRSGQPLMLTWDFFNLDQNLYKPDYSYTDGIMLWNPHTYDNKELNFSFEELITTGSQKILYVPSVDTEFNAVFTKGWYKIPINITNFSYIPTNENPGAWDIEIKYFPESIFSKNSIDSRWKGAATKFIQTGETVEPTMYSGENDYQTIGQGRFTDGIIAKLYDSYNNLTQKQIVLGDCWYRYHPEGTGSYGYAVEKYYNPSYIDGSTADTYYNIFNFSNKRPWNKAIAQLYGQSTWESQPIFTARSKVLRMAQKTDNYEDHNLNSVINMEYINIGAGVPWYDTYADPTYYISETVKCAFYYIKVWHNFELIHYYVPLPQGYWMPNGNQAPTAGFYDLITQTFINTFSTISSESNTVNQQQKRPTIANKYSYDYNYFDNWQFNIDQVDYTVKTTADTQIYQYPDTLSKKYSVIEKNTIFPVRQSTSDTENHVTGTWYNCSIGWVKANECQIISYNQTFTENRTNVALKGDTSNTATSHYGYIRPDNAIVSKIKTNYFTLDTGYQSIDTGLKAADIGKIEVVVSGHLAPKDTTNYTNRRPGYLFGNFALFTDSADLHASTTRTNEQFTIAWVDEGQKDSQGNTLFSYYINHLKQSRQRARYDKDDNYNIRIGCFVYRDDKYYIGQGKVNYHSVKIWDKNGVLIRDYTPYLVYNSNTKKYEIKVAKRPDTNAFVFKQVCSGGGGLSGTLSNPTSSGTVFNGDTSPIDDFVDPLGTKNSFTTEKVERVYYTSNDFYWNGVIWIPASYTNNYKIYWPNNKTYVVKTSNIYAYSYPINVTAYRVSNMLAGDRFVVVGNLGKDSNWLLLENGNWVFNNDTVTELEQ